LSATTCSGYETCTQGECTLGLLAPATFWPLPAAGSGNVFWWVYDWKYGSFSDGTAATCPDTTARKVGISARYYNDGAFNGQSLLAINFFKDHRCTYWDPGREAILRWYAQGMTSSATTIFDLEGSQNRSSVFLSFRGDSRWLPDRAQQTNFRDASGVVSYNINGRYAATVGGQHAFVGGYSYSFVDGDFPVYGVLPDRPISADVVITRQTVAGRIDDAGRYCSYPAGADGWLAERNTPTTCTAAADVKWALYLRKTSMTYQGKQVLYAGYSETPDSGGIGACEEWWFAQDIGPIRLGVYPTADWTTCKSRLAGTSAGGNVNDPAAHFQSRKSSMRGWLELAGRCTTTGCGVDI
jgi:hypothetical protein